MNYHEQLISEYFRVRGWFVETNPKVGRSSTTARNQSTGGWDGELDVVAFDPASGEIQHWESSLMAGSWEAREQRCRKKFELGKAQLRDVPQFSHLSDEQVANVKQFALLTSVPAGQSSGMPFAGGTLIAMDDFQAEVNSWVLKRGVVRASAIPESFPLLRALQFALCGYKRRPHTT